MGMVVMDFVWGKIKIVVFQNWAVKSCKCGLAEISILNSISSYFRFGSLLAGFCPELLLNILLISFLQCLFVNK